MEDQIDSPENQYENKSIVPKKSSIKMKIWNIACIILFTAGIVFLIFFFDKYYRFFIYNWDLILISALIAIAVIFVCFISTPRKITAVKFIFLIIAGVILAANWYIYFRYIPKYEPLDACAIVKADPKYASVTIEPQDYNGVPEYYMGETVIANPIYKIKDNPFHEWGYVLYVVSDGKTIALIGFDIATGKYELIYEPKD